MATFIVKYTHTSKRVIIVEADSEENAKILGDEGNQKGNVIQNEYSEGADTNVVTQIDEITYKDV
tara:strand:- start:2139 stop:2333 length:195 start_codon:yes stop_codon:yes gene_type:complete